MMRNISLRRLDVTEITSDIDSDHDGYNYNSSDKDTNINQMVATNVKTKNQKEAKTNGNLRLNDYDRSGILMKY